MKKIVLLAIVLICAFSCTQKNQLAQIIEKSKWVDLTYCFDESTVYWPTNVPFKHDTVFLGMNPKGYFYSSFKFSAEEHGGTHFDAPIHFNQGKNTIEKIPIEQLMGRGITIDISKKVLANRDYQVSVDDFLAWEKENGKIPEGAIVLLCTGYGQYWPDKMKYTGTTETGTKGVANLHFPGLHPDAARWLTSERKIKAIGLDTPSIDFGQSSEFMAHRILGANDVVIYENVANVDKLPQKDFWVIALPMKIKGGSGAPLRIIALV